MIVRGSERLSSRRSFLALTLRTRSISMVRVLIRMRQEGHLSFSNIRGRVRVRRLSNKSFTAGVFGLEDVERRNKE